MDKAKNNWSGVTNKRGFPLRYKYIINILREMITLEKCPVCSGNIFNKILECNDFTTSKENFTIVSCGTCTFTLTNPRPINKNLAKYYKSDMYISHTNNSKGLFNWLYQNIRKYNILTKVELLKQNTS